MSYPNVSIVTRPKAGAISGTALDAMRSAWPCGGRNHI
jgi:hypothetical protein